MTHEEMNFTVTEGMFATRKRRLQTMTISQHASGRFTVRNDKDGSIFSAGNATVEDAVRSAKYEDGRRIGVW